MKTLKMSLANIQGKLSRAEMRKVMAGSSSSGCADFACQSNSDCCKGNGCHQGYCYK